MLLSVIFSDTGIGGAGIRAWMLLLAKMHSNLLWLRYGVTRQYFDNRHLGYFVGFSGFWRCGILR